MVLLFVLLSLLLGGSAGQASAQDRPIRAELPDLLGAGNAVVETSVDYTRGAQFTLSGLEGNLFRVGLIRLGAGLSNMADFELTGGLRDRLSVTSATSAPLSNLVQPSNPSSTSAFDDIMVATKVRLVSRPGPSGSMADASSFAIRVATRLPNAKHPSGLGQDTTDFFATAIAGGSFSGNRIGAHLGGGVMGDPLQGNRRVGSLLYGLMLVRPIGGGEAGPDAGSAGPSMAAQGAEVVLAVEGRTGPSEPGLEPRSEAKAGAVWHLGRLRLEADGTLGLTSRDGNIGFALTAGFVFHAFNP